MNNKWIVEATINFLITATLLEGYHVEFYDGKDFDGFMLESYPGPDCVPLLASAQHQASSLKTDVCIMAHDREDCDYGLGNSVRIPAGEHPDLAVFHQSELNFDNQIAGFKPCANDAWGGGDLHHVEFNGPPWFGHWGDFCECTTLPEYMFGNVNSLHNFGNCVRLFSREGCLGESVDIEGGASAESRDLSAISFNGLTRSFSVCGEPTLCTRLSAEIISIDINTNPEEGQILQVDMAPSRMFYNSGKSTTTEEYLAEKSIIDVIEITRVKAMTTMTSVSVSKTAKIQDSGDGDPSRFATTKLVEVLKEAYTYTTNSSTIKAEKFMKEKDVEFKVTERIQISPCSEQTVFSYVSIVQGYSADYQVHAKIQGQKGKRRMITSELKQELSGMEYVADFDQFTIIAGANGSIVADLGLLTAVHINENPLTGCQN